MSASWCKGCRGSAGVLEPLCEECLAKVKPLSEEEIRKALEEGRKAAEAARQEWPTIPGFYR